MSRTTELSAAVRARLERYARDLPPARRLRFQLVLRSLERLGRNGPLRVLDAGAGEGILSLAIARRHPTWTIVAADIRADALQQGRAEADREGVRNVSFELLDLTRPLPDPGYDVVLAIECLEEIEDDETAVASLAAALRPDGLFLVHVPERDWEPVLHGSERRWRDEVRHGYSCEELTELLDRHGLDVSTIVATTRGTVRLAQEIRDRIKTARLATRLLAYPPLTAALWLERLGVTWGPARELYAEARMRG